MYQVRAMRELIEAREAAIKELGTATKKREGYQVCFVRMPHKIPDC